MNNHKYSASNTAKSTPSLTINNKTRLINLNNKNSKYNCQIAKRSDFSVITNTSSHKAGTAGVDK